MSRELRRTPDTRMVREVLPARPPLGDVSGIVPAPRVADSSESLFRTTNTPRPDFLKTGDFYIKDVPPVDDQTIEDLRNRMETEHPQMHAVFERHPWSLALVHQLETRAPRDMASSMQLAEIALDVVDELNTKGTEHKILPSEADIVVLAGMFSDVSRAYLRTEVRDAVYDPRVRWREFPNAWQREVVNDHPEASMNIILDAITADGATDDPRIAEGAASHHAVKREGPYGTPIENVTDPLLKKTVDIIAAVDVGEAVSRNAKGEGRGYLDDREFAGKKLTDVILTELKVDPVIAAIAAKHTLMHKKN